MADIEKVIKGLETQLDDLQKYADADETLTMTQEQAKEILELLKEQNGLAKALEQMTATNDYLNKLIERLNNLLWKMDGEQGMKDRPMVRHGIFDKENGWYVCPYCNEPIDYQVQKCRWCHKEINWEIEDGEQECR